MLSPSAIVSVCALYVVFLFLIALRVEKKAAAGRNVGNNPLIYALSLTVFHTAWTFYGSVGIATKRGMLFLAIFLGSTLAATLWWIILRKMVRIKNLYKITSLADFISLRYNKSPAIAAFVTLASIFGVVPYYALQLKAISAVFGAVTRKTVAFWSRFDIGFIFAAFIIVLTISLGVRRVAPTARHQGMVIAMAADGVVKLAAFLAIGCYVTYRLYGGLEDLFNRFLQTPAAVQLTGSLTTPSYYLSWLTYLVLSMSAVTFLPHQFHMGVVENFRSRHIRTAIWLLPLYMLLINFFVFPIAMGGLLAGFPPQQADSYVMLLALSGQNALPLLVFLGGFSAATGMIMISSMTISTMVTNHLLLPVIESLPPLAFLKRHLLQCRSVSVAMLVLAGYCFERIVGNYLFLVDIGVISFAAVLQFVPAIIGGLYWKKGSPAGALLGMGSGFLLWSYTLVLPTFVQGGLLSRELLDKGPWGISVLRPEHLLGVKGMDPATHAVFWTLLFNVGMYILGSLCTNQHEKEGDMAEEIVNAMVPAPISERLPGEATIELAAKRKELENLFSQYFTEVKASAMVEECLSQLHLETDTKISIAELADLFNQAEVRLAGAIGAAAAHSAVLKSDVISPSEEKALQKSYADIIAEMKMTPSELKRKIDYHREREKLLTLQAGELEKRVRERDLEIKERKKAEEAVRDSQRRLADIIDFLPDATFVVDTEGKVLIWNRAAEDLTGVKAAELLGKGNREYGIPFYGERRPLLVDLVLNTSEEDKMRPLYDLLVVKERVVIGESKRGDIYMFSKAAPLYDSEGKVVGGIQSIRDITRRKEAEEELKRHRDHLEELVRERTAELRVAKDRAEVANQAKSDFLSSMSHELRTPLNAVLGYTQIIKRQENLTDTQRQQLEIVHSCGEHLLTLINDILDMGKIEAKKMELEEIPFNLSALLSQVLAISRIKAEEKELAFRYEELTPLPKSVRGDPRKLRQVMLNLLSNAVKYTHHGSVITRVSHDRDSGRFVCEVADTGIGIAPEKIDLIFEPFTQLFEKGEARVGTGLGLSITKRLVTLMQGKVKAESEPGKGSTFRFELPLPVLSEEEIPEPTAGEPVIGYLGARRSILVVDDNVTNVSMLVSLLEPLGFQVVTAENGQEGVRLALKRRPDLVLLDLVMSVMNGVEAAREMRQHHELDQTRIIGTSAAVSPSPLKDSFRALCDDFLVVPIKIELLLEKIQEQLGVAWEKGPSPILAGAPQGESQEGEPFEAPPPEQLRELAELAAIGNMREIQAWGARLAEREPRYSRFSANLRELAGHFKAKAIENMVKRYLKEQP